MSDTKAFKFGAAWFLGFCSYGACSVALHPDEPLNSPLRSPIASVQQVAPSRPCLKMQRSKFSRGARINLKGFYFGENTDENKLKYDFP